MAAGCGNLFFPYKGLPGYAVFHDLALFTQPERSERFRSRLQRRGNRRPWSGEIGRSIQISIEVDETRKANCDISFSPKLGGLSSKQRFRGLQ